MVSHSPSFDVLGSIFPVWLLCIVAAVLLTVAVCRLLARLHLETELGPRALIYPSMVTLFACGLWLILFR